jgi:hypothetical protein
MFTVTLGCLGMAASGWMPLIIVTIAVINAGIVITIWRRVSHLAKMLHSKSS